MMLTSTSEIPLLTHCGGFNAEESVSLSLIVARLIRTSTAPPLKTYLARFRCKNVLLRRGLNKSPEQKWSEKIN